MKDYKIDLSMLEGEEREIVSRRIQEICFRNNVYWGVNGELLSCLSAPFIYVMENKIYTGGSCRHFENDPTPNIHYMDFIEKYDQVEVKQETTALPPVPVGDLHWWGYDPGKDEQPVIYGYNENKEIITLDPASAAVKESDIKQHQMIQEDNRELSEREKAFYDKQNAKPEPKELPEIPDIPEYDFPVMLRIGK
jgi:hypothetical protein